MHGSIKALPYGCHTIEKFQLPSGDAVAFPPGAKGDDTSMEINQTVRTCIIALAWAWLAGIACLFLSLQFSPPRFSFDAVGGALWTSIRSSLLYVLPPLLALTAWRLRQRKLNAAIAVLAACVWMMLTVGWWAIHFNPFPWLATLRNMLLLLPSILVPCLIFLRLAAKRAA
jgi:hypothetical protein